MEINNDFIKLREVVNETVTRYLDLRKELEWDDSGKSATIQRLAKPFLEGYFTVAVAGKTSSGKSTFINSLIGENLLPTGHFQTTRGITWIVSSDKRLMEVTYADGHMETYDSTADFAKELKTLVAVPSEYEKLPINHIDILIKGDDCIDDILKKKPGIELITRTSSDEELWKKYVENTPKSKIVEKVVIYLSLPKEYEGWRIIDTPGVGAIGGIQDETKKLLFRKKDDDLTKNVVDAVILLHDGTGIIEDEMTHEFAEEVSKSMGNLADGRLFFVLTHACSTTFTNVKEDILERAYNLFGKRLNITDKKITYVDSLIQLFITDAKKSSRDFSAMESLYTPFKDWNQKDWDIITPIVLSLHFELKKQGKEVSNSTIFSALEENANFGKLRDILYEFFDSEKRETFNKLMTLIEEEFDNYSARLENDKKAVSKGKSGIEAEIIRAQNEKTLLIIALNKLKQETTKSAIKDKFKFVDDKLDNLGKLDNQEDKITIADVRNDYLNIIEEGKKAEVEYFDDLKKEFKNYVFAFNEKSPTFDSLDLDKLESKAEAAATEIVVDKSRPERGELLKGGGFCSPAEYKTIYPHTKEVKSFKKKRENFINYVKKEGRVECNKYIDRVHEKAKIFLNSGEKDINNKTQNTISRLTGYQNNLEDQQVIIVNLDKKLYAVESARKDLEKYYRS